MSSSGRRKLALAVLGVVLLTGLVAIPFSRRTSKADPASPESSAQASTNETRERLQEAMKDASLLGLIQNARVASHKGDEVTRRAMVSALKKNPERARDLIGRQLSKSPDSKDVAILNRLLSELP